MSGLSSGGLRLRLLKFIIQSAQKLQVSPTVKYSALSLFMGRLYRQRNDAENWLLHRLQLHDSQVLSVKTLKSLGDKMIKDQHFTTRDFLEAVLNFEIGISNTAFRYLEDLFFQFGEVATVGKLVNFEACLDIMDLLYEKEETSTLYGSPKYLAASVLIASYVTTVPKQKWEFPVVPWVKFVTSCREEQIMEIVRDILKHIFEPSPVV